MNAMRLVRFFEGLIIVMVVGWAVNFYLEISRNPINWPGAAAVPLILLIFVTALLRSEVRGRIARDKEAAIRVSNWRWAAAVGMFLIALAVLLLGFRAHG